MDIRSKDVLKQALQRYDGTLVLVSHDRDFLDGLVTKVYEFRDGMVKEHLGGISDFLERVKIGCLQELEKVPLSETKQVEKEEASPIVIQKTEAKISYQEQKETRRREKQLEMIEKSIAKLEEEMKKIEAHLSAPTPQTDIESLTRDYLELKRKYDIKMEEWLEFGND